MKLRNVSVNYIGAIKPDICEKIISLGLSKIDLAKREGISLEGKTPIQREKKEVNIRKSEVIGLNEKWIYEIFTPMLIDANKHAGWNWQINSSENMQFAIYHGSKENGGFYEVAKTLSTDENDKMSFSIIPTESKSLLQLRVSTTSPIENQIESGTEINPLEFFNINEITRSNYFSDGNYPLNSLFQIIILSDEENNVSDVKGNIIPTQTIEGIEMPTDITKKGWVFDPKEGEQIQGKYIFGDSE